MDQDEICGLIGLTKLESKVYFSLVELKEARSGILSAESSVPTSHLYKVLESLIDKGLVSFRLKNNVRIYYASSPDMLKEMFIERQALLEKKRGEVDSLVSSLKMRPFKVLFQADYRYFEGIQGLKAVWLEVNSSMTKDYIIKVYTGRKGIYENVITFFDEHHKYRQSMGVRERLIFPIDDPIIAKKRMNELTEARLLPLDNECEWGVCNELFFIITFPSAKNPFAMLIKNSSYAKTFEQVYDQLWALGKEVV